MDSSKIHLVQGIPTLQVQTAEEGMKYAQELLCETSGKDTLLFLSGGRTPKDMYHTLSEDKELSVGAVALVDERYGPKLHPNSNELMIKESGLLSYLEFINVSFHPILEESATREETAKHYDETVRFLFNGFSKTIAILGIGLDGHTAGIAGERDDFQNPMFERDRQNLFVSEFNDKTGMFKERVTMTFLALSMVDMLLVLVFGEDKKEALEKMFQDGREDDIPARFFKRPDVSKKTLLITDQKV